MKLETWSYGDVERYERYLDGTLFFESDTTIAADGSRTVRESHLLDGSTGIGVIVHTFDPLGRPLGYVVEQHVPGARTRRARSRARSARCGGPGAPTARARRT